MKKDKLLTERYLLPLNLSFLSLFGVFLIYELDKTLMLETQESSSVTALIICGLATALLASSIKFRHRYFHGFCVVLSIVALAILSWPS